MARIQFGITFADSLQPEILAAMREKLGDDQAGMQKIKAFLSEIVQQELRTIVVQRRQRLAREQIGDPEISTE